LVSLRTIYSLILLLTLLPGCQGGAQSDVVERELRWQEDQLYAMEDYLMEYQSKLRRSRAENVALKRQLGDTIEGSSGPVSIEPLPEETLPLPKDPKRTGPKRASPKPSLPEFDMPDIPSLDSSLPEETLEEVVPLAWVEPLPGELKIEQASDRSTLPDHVRLTGEVLTELDNEEEGPRLVVDVEPRTASGARIPFRGRVSLMVLDPQKSAGSKRIARWDLSSLDAEEETAETRLEGFLRFGLQLPAETPAETPLEIWVRLEPELEPRLDSEEGPKLLAHAELMLEPGALFSSFSQTMELHPIESHLEEPASLEIPQEAMPIMPQKPVIVQADSLDERITGSWQIARPGKTADAPSRKPEEASGWRVASGPIPTSLAVPSELTEKEPVWSPHR